VRKFLLIGGVYDVEVIRRSFLVMFCYTDSVW